MIYSTLHTGKTNSVLHLINDKTDKPICNTKSFLIIGHENCKVEKQKLLEEYYDIDDGYSYTESSSIGFCKTCLKRAGFKVLLS